MKNLFIRVMLCIALFASFIGCETDDVLVKAGDASTADSEVDASVDAAPTIPCVGTDGSWCDDGNACTKNDMCWNSVCVSGEKIICSDGLPCTEDLCNSQTGCVFNPTAPGTPCDDANACTLNETCNTGGDCTSLIIKTCDDGNLCTTDTCSPQKGCTFIFTPGEKCDDGNLCTTPDVCIGNACKPGLELSCNDNNPCTFDQCNPQTGTCIMLPLSAGAPCSDDNLCTSPDACKDGACKSGGTVSCNDGDACTTEKCNPANGSCEFVFTNNPSTTCSDNDACTEGDTCNAGLKKCQGTIKTVCTDGNLCTTDTCDTQKGCMFTPSDGEACSDGNACTLDDKCSGKKCLSGTLNACNDDNACTADTCQQDTGACKNTPTVGWPCSDGNACTLNDKCSTAGTCAGQISDCNDGNDCTSNGCDIVGGCVFTAVSGVACNDNNPCTTKEFCNEGVCLANSDACNDGKDCTIDSCDAKTASCVFVPLNVANGESYLCKDNNPCVIAGKCVAGGVCEVITKTCDDQNPCTTDFCSASTGQCNYFPIAGCKK